MFHWIGSPSHPLKKEAWSPRLVWCKAGNPLTRVPWGEQNGVELVRGVGVERKYIREDFVIYSSLHLDQCYNDAAWLSESFYCTISIIISLMEMWKTFTTVIVVYFLWSYQWTIMNSCVGLSILLSCEFSSRLVPNLLIKMRGVASFT